MRRRTGRPDRPDISSIIYRCSDLSWSYDAVPCYCGAMAANFKAELVACFGQPVAENPTGVMQEAAFRALGLEWRYLTVEVAPADLSAAILGMRAFGMRGCNLTIPHKVAVMRHLDEVAPDAALI